MTADALRRRPWHQPARSLFDALHGWPPRTGLPVFRLGWHAARMACRVLPQGCAVRGTALSAWKRFNIRLSDLEARARRQRLTSLPIHLTLETTMRCNLRCPHYFRSHLTAGPDHMRRLADMDIRLLRSIVRSLFPTAWTVNLGMGAEPLLTKHLELIIDAAKRYRVKLDVITNGTLLRRPGLLDHLVPMLQRIEISLDSTVPEQFERLRYPARFALVMENFRELARRRLRMPPPRFELGISLVAMRPNARQLPEVIRLVSEAGGTHVRVNPLLIFDPADVADSLVSEPELYNEILREAEAIAAETGLASYAPGPFVSDEPEQSPRPEPCLDIYRSTFISHDGLVRTRCQYDPRVAGDLTTQPFGSIWNCALMRGIRRNYDTSQALEVCKTCFMAHRGPGTVQDRARQQFAFLSRSKSGGEGPMDTLGQAAWRYGV